MLRVLVAIMSLQLSSRIEVRATLPALEIVVLHDHSSVARVGAVECALSAFPKPAEAVPWYVRNRYLARMKPLRNAHPDYRMIAIT